MAWVSLCELQELSEGEAKYVEIDGFHLAVVLNHGGLFVLDSTCPHAGANLASGLVQNDCLQCPRHAWAFELETGQLRNSPGVAVSRYETRVYAFGEKKLVQADLPSF